MADDQFKVQLEGKEYDLDDFELGELEWLEEELGSLDDDALKTMKAAVRFVTVIKRRDDPKFTVEQARKLKITIFDDPAQKNGNGNGARPTKAAKAAAPKRKPAGSGATS